MASPEKRPTVFSEFFGGVSFLFRGLKVWGTAPKLMVLGMIPAVVVGALFLAGLIVLGVNLERLAELVTPFASPWDEPYRTGIRIVAGLALLAVAILVVVYAFTTVTLLVGQPFYEQIWKHVERRFGELPQSETGWWRTFWVTLGAGIRILIPTILIAFALFVIGFVPVVGQILVPVLGAFFGGWFLTLELTGLAFEGRGMTLKDRRIALRSRRARTLGFGVASYVSFLIPLGAVIMMPAAVAGATLLARSALGEDVSVPPRRQGRPAVDRTGPGRQD